MDAPRRSFLVRAGQGLAGLGLAVLTWGAARVVWPFRVRDLSRRVVLGPATALPPGSSRHLAGPDVHVIHTTGGIYALSGRCTHLGCSLRRSPEGFSCPCHGARFDLEGQPLSGPALRTLTAYRLSQTSDGTLVLDLDETVPSRTLLRI